MYSFEMFFSGIRHRVSAENISDVSRNMNYCLHVQEVMRGVLIQEMRKRKKIVCI
jgi:hypothetical protein